MSWARLEAEAPDLAGSFRERLTQTRVAVMGTIRSDGLPRISSIEPCILGGELYLGMMWRSRKALDLRRDPRIVIRNAICTSTGDEEEVVLRGRAREVEDPEVRRRYREAVADRIVWAGDFHLFSVEIESAALIAYGEGRQRVRLWPQGVELERPYG